MRIEIQAILWVTAAAAIAMVVFHGAMTATNVLSWEQEVRAATPLRPALKTSSLGSQPEEAALPVSAAAPANERLLFKVHDVSQPAPTPVEAVEQPPPKPALVLRGIVSEGGSTRAVVASTDTGPDYLIVNVGDEVGGYRVLSIDRESVALEGADGSRSTMKLRGAGEAP